MTEFHVRVNQDARLAWIEPVPNDDADYPCAEGVKTDSIWVTPQQATERMNAIAAEWKRPTQSPIDKSKLHLDGTCCPICGDCQIDFGDSHSYGDSGVDSVRCGNDHYYKRHFVEIITHVEICNDNEGFSGLKPEELMFEVETNKIPAEPATPTRHYEFD